MTKNKKQQLGAGIIKMIRAKEAGIPYKTGQVWQAAHPMCWEVCIYYVKMDKAGQPLFVISDINSPGLFHRKYNDTSYLFTPEALDCLLGEDRELIKVWNGNRWVGPDGKELG